jgi:FO synthase
VDPPAGPREGPACDEVRRIADALRQETVGDEVTYVVNRNINFTNICYTGCRLCAFAQRRTDADAFSLSLDQVADRAEHGDSVRLRCACRAG